MKKQNKHQIINLFIFLFKQKTAHIAAYCFLYLRYKFYLFDHVGAFLAFFKPGFFLSLILGSLFKNP